MTEDLTLQSQERELVAAIHGGGLDLPMPFERDLFLMELDIAGTSYIPNIASLYASLTEGDTLQLLREPENPYDTNAVRIDVIDPDHATDGVKLGYIPRYCNQVFANLMDAGKLLYAVVSDKHKYNDYHKVGVRIYMRD